MADVSREVRIAFEGIDRVSAVTQKISGHIDAFAGSVQSATQPLANMADQILKVEAAAATLAVGGLFLSLKAYASFESASAELNKVLDQNTESLSTAEAEARKLALTYGESSSDILLSFANFRQAGFDLSESMTLTKDALDLVIAGDLDMHNASEILISTLKGLKLGFEDGRRAIDNMNEVSNNYATNVRELGLGMQELSPIAKQMGLSMEDMIAILTPVIEVFRSGSEAGTALRTTLLKLYDDSSAVEEAFEILEVAQKDATGAFRDGREILFDVIEAFGQLEDSEKAYIAMQLTGIRQASKAIEVFNNLEYVLGVLETQTHSAGSAWREVEIRLQTVEKQVDIFIESIRDLGIEIGENFAEGAVEVVSGATEISQALGQIVDAGTFDPIFIFIEDFAKKLGSDLRKIAEVMPEAFAGLDWSGLISSLKGLGGEIEDIFRAFFGDIDLTTAEGLRDFIQKLIDSFTALTNVSSSILNALEPFIETLGEMFDTFAESDTDTQEFIGRVLGLGKAINVLSGYVPILTSSLSFLADIFQILLITRIPGVIGSMGQLGTAASGLIGTMGAWAGAIALGALAANELGKVIRSFVPGVDTLAKSFQESVLSLRGYDTATIDAIVNQAKHTEAMGMAAVAAVRVKEALGELPSQINIVAVDLALEDYFSDIDAAEERLAQVPAEKEVVIKGKADATSLQQAEDFIVQTVPGEQRPDGTFEMITEIVFRGDEESKEQAIKELEEVPSEKIIIARIENQTKVEIEAIKAAAATVQTAVEWEARIEIAEVEQLFETLRTQSESIRDMWAESGEVIQSITSGFEHLGPLGRSDLMEILRQEMENRANLVEQQRLLTEAEVRYLDEKTRRLAEGGEGLITIQMEGIYPELELVMHKIIERTQIRATQEGLDFLIGA